MNILHRVPEEEGEEEKVRAPPTFVSKPELVTVEEGDWSRFCCRVTGHPRPRVMWIINGHTVVNVSINIFIFSNLKEKNYLTSLDSSSKIKIHCEFL